MAQQNPFTLISRQSNQVSEREVLTTTPETKAESALRLDVLPNQITDRASATILADYVSGTPVILSIRLVNAEAKRHPQTAASVTVPRNWQKYVAFSVIGTNGVRVPALIPCPVLKEPQDELSSTVELHGNELYGYWLISSDVTTDLLGEHRLVAAWKNAKSREIRVQFHKPVSDDDAAKVLMGQAQEHILLRRYDKACLLLSEIVRKQGERFDDGNRAVLLLMGDALAGANRKREALEAYRRFVSLWRESRTSERDEPDLVLLKIRLLERECGATP